MNTDNIVVLRKDYRKCKGKAFSHLVSYRLCANGECIFHILRSEVAY